MKYHRQRTHLGVQDEDTAQQNVNTVSINPR